jgi:hypothetical protein
VPTPSSDSPRSKGGSYCRLCVCTWIEEAGRDMLWGKERNRVQLDHGDYQRRMWTYHLDDLLETAERMSSRSAVCGVEGAFLARDSRIAGDEVKRERETKHDVDFPKRAEKCTVEYNQLTSLTGNTMDVDAKMRGQDGN